LNSFHGGGRGQILIATARFTRCSLLCCGILLLLSTSAKLSAAEKERLADAAPAPRGDAFVEARPTTDALAKPVEAQDSKALDTAALDTQQPQVRLMGIRTDVAKRYRAIIPPLPLPPFNHWRDWFQKHEDAVHCAVEWCNDKGEWFHGEMRSTHFDVNAKQFRVGWGEFPGTAYDAYGVYIMPGRLTRDKDSEGNPLVITVDEAVQCDWRRVEEELKNYAAKYAIPGEPGTGGIGRENVGLGGPAYKPTQNSNTMIKYVLRACGFTRPAPDKAIGWETEPSFPYSSDADAPRYDSGR
jgi:hypothetical protein